MENELNLSAERCNGLRMARVTLAASMRPIGATHRSIHVRLGEKWYPGVYHNVPSHFPHVELAS